MNKLKKSTGIIAGASLVVAGVGSCESPVRLENEKPYIVFILADDLGYMDICRYAGNLTGAAVSDMFYETPHLDALMASGISFSQAYACPLCAPTRSTLLTGKYASRLGFTTAVPPRNTYYNQGITPPEGF